MSPEEKSSILQEPYPTTKQKRNHPSYKNPATKLRFLWIRKGKEFSETKERLNFDRDGANTNL
jgi:hypothetical protein